MRSEYYFHEAQTVDNCNAASGGELDTIEMSTTFTPLLKLERAISKVS